MKLILTDLEANLITATLTKLEVSGLLSNEVAIIAQMIKNKLDKERNKENKAKSHQLAIGVH